MRGHWPGATDFEPANAGGGALATDNAEASYASPEMRDYLAADADATAVSEGADLVEARGADAEAAGAAREAPRSAAGRSAA